MTWLRRLRSGAAAYGVAAVLGACALAFLAFAAYLQLATTLTPALAALVTGAGLLLLAVLVVLAYWATTGPGSGHRHGRRPGDEPMDGLEEILEKSVDPALSRWLRRNPQRAALAMLLLGFGAGYSRSVRRVVQDLYNQYAETEKERRASGRD